jgi:hypothetical protein
LGVAGHLAHILLQIRRLTCTRLVQPAPSSCAELLFCFLDLRGLLRGQTLPQRAALDDDAFGHFGEPTDNLLTLIRHTIEMSISPTPCSYNRFPRTWLHRSSPPPLSHR